LSAFDLAAIGFGSVVGTGIFVATGQGAHLAGPAVLVSFLIAAITAGLCALTYSELASMFPSAGSTYSYAYVAFGEIVAWMIGWNLILEYLVAASAVASAWSAITVGLLRNAGIHIPKLISDSPLDGGLLDVFAVMVTVFVTWLLYIGIKESVRANNLIVILKVAVILLFVVLGFSHIELPNFQPFSPFGWEGIMQGAAIIFFTYLGFDAVSTASEETRNPRRDVPLGLMLCLGGVIVIYLLVALTLVGMVPFQLIDIKNALPSALARAGIQWGSALVAVGAIVGMVSTLLITLYGQVRIFMVMARDGLLPKTFAKIHPRYKTPHVCTLVSGLAAALIAGILPLPLIIDLCNIGTLSAFIVVSIGVIVLRRTLPNFERKFRCPGVPFTPLITSFFCFYLMMHLQKITWINFTLWLIVGLFIYFLYGIRRSYLQKRQK
jgi:APA family basic amino acid/polyamine antiporter